MFTKFLMIMLFGFTVDENCAANLELVESQEKAIAKKVMDTKELTPQQRFEERQQELAKIKIPSSCWSIDWDNQKKENKSGDLRRVNSRYTDLYLLPRLKRGISTENEENKEETADYEIAMIDGSVMDISYWLLIHASVTNSDKKHVTEIVSLEEIKLN